MLYKYYEEKLGTKWQSDQEIPLPPDQLVQDANDIIAEIIQKGLDQSPAYLEKVKASLNEVSSQLQYFLNRIDNSFLNNILDHLFEDPHLLPQKGEDQFAKIYLQLYEIIQEFCEILECFDHQPKRIPAKFELRNLISLLRALNLLLNHFRKSELYPEGAGVHFMVQRFHVQLIKTAMGLDPKIYESAHTALAKDDIALIQEIATHRLMLRNQCEYYTEEEFLARGVHQEVAKELKWRAEVDQIPPSEPSKEEGYQAYPNGEPRRLEEITSLIEWLGVHPKMAERKAQVELDKQQQEWQNSFRHPQLISDQRNLVEMRSLLPDLHLIIALILGPKLH